MGTCTRVSASVAVTWEAVALQQRARVGTTADLRGTQGLAATDTLVQRGKLPPSAAGDATIRSREGGQQPRPGTDWAPVSVDALPLAPGPLIRHPRRQTWFSAGAEEAGGGFRI